MKDAIRNVRDLLIDPYRAFMRLDGKGSFNVAQYILYIVSVVIVEFGEKGAGAVLDMICILASVFLTGWSYWAVIRACGGNLSYWKSLNAQVCMGTFANIGGLFELGNVLQAGSAISFAVSIYCVYLHIRCIIAMSGAMVKRTIIVYIAIFISTVLVVYIGFGLLGAAIISERGYIG